MSGARDPSTRRGLFAGWIDRIRGRGPDGLRRPYVRHHDGFVSLQFVRAQTQSRMVAGDPGRLLVDYTRTMFGALLWQPAPRVLGMVGLGGGSQLKFAHAHMPGTRIEVVMTGPWLPSMSRGLPEAVPTLAPIAKAAHVATSPDRMKRGCSGQKPSR